MSKIKFRKVVGEASNTDMYPSWFLKYTALETDNYWFSGMMVVRRI